MFGANTGLSFGDGFDAATGAAGGDGCFADTGGDGFAAAGALVGDDCFAAAAGDGLDGFAAAVGFFFSSCDGEAALFCAFFSALCFFPWGSFVWDARWAIGTSESEVDGDAARLVGFLARVAATGGEDGASVAATGTEVGLGVAFPASVGDDLDGARSGLMATFLDSGSSAPFF